MPFEEYRARHLQRFQLGTSYPSIVKRVIEIREKLGGGTLVIDATGVGRPVVDLFWEAGLTPWAVTITGTGDAHNQERESVKKRGMFYTPTLREKLTWNVPKRDLVGVLSVTFQNHVLKVSSKLPDAKTLTDELLNFKVKINTKTAHDSYEAWREGEHDDLVLSVALALWVAVHHGGDQYFIGLDLGQASDYTALSIIEGATTRTERYLDPGAGVPSFFGHEDQVNPIRKLRQMQNDEGCDGGDLPGISV